MLRKSSPYDHMKAILEPKAKLLFHCDRDRDEAQDSVEEQGANFWLAFPRRVAKLEGAYAVQ